MEQVKEKKQKRSKQRVLTPDERAAKRQRQNMQRRAAILSIEQCNDNTFRVWGGESEHVLIVLNGLVICDCRGWRYARNNVCSHVYKHAITYGDLKRK